MNHHLNKLKCDAEGVPLLVQDYTLYNIANCIEVKLFNGYEIRLDDFWKLPTNWHKNQKSREEYINAMVMDKWPEIKVHFNDDYMEIVNG